MPAFETVGTRAVVEGLSGYDRAADRIEDSNRRMGVSAKRAADKSTLLNKALGTLRVVGPAAVAGIGLAALNMAKNFETSFAEVTTLFDASEEQVAELRSGVLDLSKTMGIDAVENTKALYQAISAGVAPAEALAFIEQNAKLAVGGVTDLGTAVDLTTTILNAFGLQMTDLTRVSDVLFTGVRLGKTTIDELGRSMFNVAPIAAAAGVKIEDVVAAMAALTAGGTPTSVAATQLRQAFAEMGKEGTKANRAFRQIAGKGFREFIASGGNVVRAMELLRVKAIQDNVAVSDLFGSIEAGTGVQVLAGEGAEAFARAVEEMGESAGATDVAFDKMNDTLERQAAILFTKVKVALIEVAQKGLPAMTAGAKIAGAAFSDLIGGIGLVTGVVAKNKLAFAGLATTIALLKFGPMIADMVRLTRQFGILNVLMATFRGTTLGPLGIVGGIALVTGGLIAMNKVFGEGSDEVGEATDALAVFREELEAIGVQAERLGIAPLTRQVARFGQELDLRVEAVARLATRLAAVNQEVEDFGPVSRLNIIRLMELQKESEELSSNLERQQGAVRGVHDEVSGLNVDYRELAAAVADGSIELKLANSLFPGFQTALEESGEVAAIAAGGVGDLAEQFKKLKDAVNESTDALRLQDDIVSQLTGRESKEERQLRAVSSGLDFQIKSIKAMVSAGAKLGPQDEKRLENLKAQKDAIDAQRDVLRAFRTAQGDFIKGNLEGALSLDELSDRTRDVGDLLIVQGRVQAGLSQKVASFKRTIDELRLGGFGALADDLEARALPALELALGRLDQVDLTADDAREALLELGRTKVDVSVNMDSVREAQRLTEELLRDAVETFREVERTLQPAAAEPEDLSERVRQLEDLVSVQDRLGRKADDLKVRIGNLSRGGFDVLADSIETRMLPKMGLAVEQLVGIFQRANEARSALQELGETKIDIAVRLGSLREARRLLEELFQQAISTFREVGQRLPPLEAFREVERRLQPGPAEDFHAGGVVPGPMGQPVMAVVHGGERIIPVGAARAGATITVTVPFTVQQLDWSEIRETVHEEVDVALDQARSTSLREGAPLGSGIG